MTKVVVSAYVIFHRFSDKVPTAGTGARKRSKATLYKHMRLCAANQYMRFSTKHRPGGIIRGGLREHRLMS